VSCVIVTASPLKLRTCGSVLSQHIFAYLFWGRWALVSPDGAVPSQMIGVFASVKLPLHHEVHQKFRSGTGSPGWSRKWAVKRLWWCYFVLQYLGYRTNAVSFEVDERYRRFGFEIEDSPGRCRVLRHHTLGSRPFVGCVFTTATVSHPLIASLAFDQQVASLAADDNEQ